MKQTIVTTLGEVEEQLEDEYFDRYEVPYGDACIFVDSYRMILPEIHLSLRSGVMCYQAEDGYYEDDFAVKLIYKEDETAPEKYLYWEEDDLLRTVGNYPIHNKPKDLAGLICIVIVED